MLEKSGPTTLVTVTYPSDKAFIERFPRMLAYFTPPQQVSKHFVVLNDQTRDFVRRVEAAFSGLPWLVDFVGEPENRWDLPAYNDVADLIETQSWIGISPDTRVFDHTWISDLLGALEANVGLVGKLGPCADLTPADINHPEWGWVPRLLVERNLPFERTEHIQTWCFCVLHEAFKEVGGFWEREDKRVTGKGDLIAAEVFLSVAMRQAGWEIRTNHGPLFHYGTRGADSQEAIDAFDRHNGWEIHF